jgi:hypothetical protein
MLLLLTWCLFSGLSSTVATSSTKIRRNILRISRLCSHLQMAVQPTLMRMDDLSRLPLGAATVNQYNGTRPYPQQTLVLNVQYSKANQHNTKTDLRALTHGRSVHTCPLVHLAFIVILRLMFHDGRPLHISSVRNRTWCAPTLIQKMVTCTS